MLCIPDRCIKFIPCHYRNYNEKPFQDTEKATARCFLRRGCIIFPLSSLILVVLKLFLLPEKIHISCCRYHAQFVIGKPLEL